MFALDKIMMTTLSRATGGSRLHTEVAKEKDGWWRSWQWILGLLLPVAAILAFAIFQPILVLPRMGLGPGFGLIDQNGNRLTNEDLRGHVVLYNFTYTNCASPCPQTTALMAELHTQVGALKTYDIPIDLVTISFDPVRDTPQQLQTFAAQFMNETEFGPDQTNALVPWHFVTGEPLPLKYIIGGGFGSYYQANDDGSFTFDQTFVLVDGAGIIRAKYRNAPPSLAILQRDIELVTKEAKESTGATRLAYEAAHLFLCYPK